MKKNIKCIINQSNTYREHFGFRFTFGEYDIFVNGKNTRFPESVENYTLEKKAYEIIADIADSIGFELSYLLAEGKPSLIPDMEIFFKR